MPAYIVFLEADLITWKMKQGLRIQSLQPIALHTIMNYLVIQNHSLGNRK